MLGNPEKCVATCSSTVDFAKKGLALPTFEVQGTPIEFTHEDKYLGFWLSSTLSGETHLKKLLSRLRKSIIMFKSATKFKKRSLLLLTAKIYVVPVMHNLEFVGRISKAQHDRFDYLLRRFFNFRSAVEYKKFKKHHKFLDLRFLHEKARLRFKNDF